MKELSIEEKAKRYNEALERARKLQENSNGMILKKWLWNIFPELKESKDNRIMKVIRGWIYTRPASFFDNGISKEEILAWLEQQGEQNLIVADSPQLGDQKPTDKFKVGDWVVSGQFVTQIREIAGDGYVNSHNGFIPFESAKYYHLWTIQDAKDGDVVVCDINKAEIGGDIEKLPNITPTISIYMKTVKDQDFIHTYCSLYNRSSLVPYNAMYYKTFVYNIHPATKEQRNALMKVMTDAGYTFDFEKKELKGNEQKSYGQRKECLDCQFNYAGECEGSCQMKRDEQKSVWSEEDERICQCLIRDQEEALDEVRNDKYGHSEIISDLKEMYRERIDWLESLKERIGG